jgi:hypothetical protein
MPNKKSEQNKGILRHLLTLIGGILVTLGVLSPEDTELLITSLLEVIGGAMVLWGVIASWLNKEKILDDGNA